MSINDIIFNSSHRQAAEDNKLSGLNSNNVFELGAVVNILIDPDNPGQFLDEAQEIDPTVQPQRIPRNSIIVRRVTDGADSIGGNVALAYPFFSSHLNLPVKPGEMVWLFFPGNQQTRGYWLTRAHADEFSEDLNYSHYDRSIVPPPPSDQQTIGTYEKSRNKGDYSQAQKESAPNDGDFPNYSLEFEGEPYEEISNIIRDMPIVREPVPRLKKRPGDFVIQGSNNSAIILSSNRGWQSNQPGDADSQSNVLKEVPEGSGAIDMVVGRSRGLPNGKVTRTSPEVYQNSRGYSEVAKEGHQGKDGGLAEGDPDLVTDAARLFVSMHVNPDSAFELRENTPTTPGQQSPVLSDNSSAAVAKADNIRIIARKDDEFNVNGSVSIIKEGDLPGDNCAIRLMPDGSILISGDKIFIGRSGADGGLEEGPPDAPGRSQPFVRYKQLEDLLSNIISDVNAFCDTLVTHVTPGFGAPSPQITQAAAELKIKMLQRELEIPRIKSKRIFGE